MKKEKFAALINPLGIFLVIISTLFGVTKNNILFGFLLGLSLGTFFIYIAYKMWDFVYGDDEKI